MGSARQLPAVNNTSGRLAIMVKARNLFGMGGSLMYLACSF
jgi:hypothetical protein